MNSKRIMMINSVLFLVILALSALVLTEERTVPEAPPIKELVRTVETQLANSQGAVVSNVDAYQNLGKRNILDTLVPLPTPTPRPTPTPKPPPVLAEVTEYWKLGGVLSKMVVFEDIKTREPFTMRIGESKEVEFKKEKLTIVLEAIDRAAWKATIKMTYGGNVQRRELKMQ